MELSIRGQVLKWARQMELSGGLSLCKAVGWNMKNRSHLMVARRLPGKTHPTLLIVTIREGKEQGICSATLEGLLRVVKDQVEEGLCSCHFAEQRIGTVERGKHEDTIAQRAAEICCCW